MADSKFSFQEVGRIYEPAWMSPEALSKKPSEINLEASDMWSFAVLLWELATREVPFADLSPMECGMKVHEVTSNVTMTCSRFMNVLFVRSPWRICASVFRQESLRTWPSSFAFA